MTEASADELRGFLASLAVTPATRLLEIGSDLGPPLAFPDETFDAILCLDAIVHLPDRGAALCDWARVLAPGGRIVYTDPAIVAGLVTSEELAIRGSSDLFVVSPQGENESLIESAGLRLLRADDATDAAALLAGHRYAERAEREAKLVATERRLVWIAFVAEKPA